MLSILSARFYDPTTSIARMYWVNAGNYSSTYRMPNVDPPSNGTHLLNAVVESKWVNDVVAVYLATQQV